MGSFSILAFSIGLPFLQRSTVSAGRKDVPVGLVVGVVVDARACNVSREECNLEGTNATVDDRKAVAEIKILSFIMAVRSNLLCEHDVMKLKHGFTVFSKAVVTSGLGDTSVKFATLMPEPSTAIYHSPSDRTGYSDIQKYQRY
jgi:hypothetical protein